MSNPSLDQNKKIKLVLCFALANALVLCGAKMAHAALVYDHEGQSLDIFGKVQAAFMNNETYEDHAKESDSTADSAYAKMELGLGMRSKLAHGADAIAMALFDTTAEGGQEGVLNSTRYLFAGIDAYQYGTLIMGKGDGAYYTVVGATDIFNIIETNASDYYRLGEQRPSQIMYSLHALDWDLTLSYMTARDGLGEGELDVQYGYGASVSSKFGENITFAYGIDHYDFSYGRHKSHMEEYFAAMLAADQKLSYNEALSRIQNQHIGYKRDLGFAVSYGHVGVGQGLYAALVFGTTSYEYLGHHIYNLDSVVSYSFRDFSGLTVSAGYGMQRYEGYNIVSDLNLGASYSFNPAFKIFAEAQFDLNGEANKFYGNEISQRLNLNEDKFAIGAELNF